eukprot:1157820-Pelagomonas_calceolata.AAC.1
MQDRVEGTAWRRWQSTCSWTAAACGCTAQRWTATCSSKCWTPCWSAALARATTCCRWCEEAIEVCLCGVGCGWGGGGSVQAESTSHVKSWACQIWLLCSGAMLAMMMECVSMSNGGSLQQQQQSHRPYCVHAAVTSALLCACSSHTRSTVCSETQQCCAFACATVRVRVLLMAVSWLGIHRQKAMSWTGGKALHRFGWQMSNSKQVSVILGSKAVGWYV